jgi:hypothetical protein
MRLMCICLLFCILVLPLFCSAFNGVTDHKTGNLLSSEWLEAGFVDLDDSEWVTVTTKSTKLGSTLSPSRSQPTDPPTYWPNSQPTLSPSSSPSNRPSGSPSSIPTTQPTSTPSSFMEREFQLTERFIDCFQNCDSFRFDWTLNDFCTLYHSQACKRHKVENYTCQPECLLSCPDVFCDSFSSLVFGCDHKYSHILYSNKSATEQQCLETVAGGEVTLTQFIFDVELELKGVDPSIMATDASIQNAVAVAMSLTLAGIPQSRMLYVSSFAATGSPSGVPSGQPSLPSGSPTGDPSSEPTTWPTCPSGDPSVYPSGEPTATDIPTFNPSAFPSAEPSCQPTRAPLAHPSCVPTGKPSTQPTTVPSAEPSCPTNTPTTVGLEGRVIPAVWESGKRSVSGTTEYLDIVVNSKDQWVTIWNYDGSQVTTKIACPSGTAVDTGPTWMFGGENDFYPEAHGNKVYGCLNMTYPDIDMIRIEIKGYLGTNTISVMSNTSFTCQHAPTDEQCTSRGRNICSSQREYAYSCGNCIYGHSTIGTDFSCPLTPYPTSEYFKPFQFKN